MSSAIEPVKTEPLILHLSPTLSRMSEHEFFEFCQLNREWRIERTREGDLLIMPPTGGQTGKRNFTLTAQFGVWAEAGDSGIGFDSSTGFILPNGAKRSPDLAWVRRSRWDALSAEEKEEFPPLCPDFVVELRSHSDSLKMLQEKMQEYVDNGALLGWLIDTKERKVYVYRPAKAVCCLDDPETLSGDPILPGFVLDLRKIWA